MTAYSYLLPRGLMSLVQQMGVWILPTRAKLPRFAIFVSTSRSFADTTPPRPHRPKHQI